MASSRNRKRRRRKGLKRGSWIGNLLLELVAIAALLFALAASGNFERQNNDTDRLSFRSAGIGTALAAFFKDQLEYQQWNSN